MSNSALIDLSRNTKRFLAVATDSSLCVLTVWVAICFRFESWVSLSGYQWLAVVLSIALAIPLLTMFGFYHTVIRFAGKQTIMAALRAIGLYSILFSAIFTAYGFPLVPRTIGVLQPLLLLIGLGIVRIVASQLLSEQVIHPKELVQSPNVLIYGAGNSGQQLAASIRSSGQSRVIGFIDDNTSLHKAQIAGIPVHSPSTIPELTQRHNVRDVLLAMPNLTRTRRNEIIKLLGKSKVAVRTLPSLSDLASGKVAETDLRELDIEDLLGRDPIAPIQELLTKNITNKAVLVTGAGGSIGSELCRQIAKLCPKQLILLDVSEFALYTINEELVEIAKSDNFVLKPILADVQDQARVRQIIAEYSPNTVYHAAAYKHVPLVESNALAGLRNNVLGTLNVAQAALAHGVSDVVLISTDKAVRPTNIMGASKRLAEMVLQYVGMQAKSTNFCIVRFGNVLGSSGSVVPKFRAQIEAGGPVTITHPEITRYFMTIPEAAQLVIQASAMHQKDSYVSPLYLLDMGDSVKITQLAETMISLSGLQVNWGKEYIPDSIQIVFTGLREGEKLYEELLISGQPVPTAHSKIMLSREETHFLNSLLPCVESWLELLQTNQHSSQLNKEHIIALLKKSPEIGYQQAGKNL